MYERPVPFDSKINYRRKEKELMFKKVSTLFSLIVLLALVLSACAAPAAPTEPPATAEPTATEPPTPEPTEPPATAEATEAPVEEFPEGVTAVITITLP